MSSISAIICQNIGESLAEKYPLLQFHQMVMTCHSEGGEGKGHAIVGPGFNVSVMDVKATVAKTQWLISTDDRVCNFKAGTDKYTKHFDLAHPDAIDALLIYVDTMIKQAEGTLG
jgi:hypothetical protein